MVRSIDMRIFILPLGPRPAYGEGPYEKIDHEKTRVANGLSNGGQSNQGAHDKTPLLNRLPSNDSVLDRNDHRRSRSRDRSEKTSAEAKERRLAGKILLVAHM